ncbi:hypothetical protein N7495_006580 [Penicillium taxi]|uniref:uncharacterized protein n=1 Tax=Penicillium taxi TaxID=168475 RepID=UPI00254517B8|nr:uncharacterized protein N7495_006580 [Penicillium taxi]KAJ5894889.1 hypothetical protein N7495_006580 [Penicillium taxi]
MHLVWFSTLLVLAQQICALPTEINRPSLEVTLSQVDGTRIKAVVQNTGDESLTFVHLNFFRDSAPVKKVKVYQNNSEVAFQGIRRSFRFQGLTLEALTTLNAGEVLEDEFDIAATSDIAHGGLMTLQSSGLVPLVQDGNVSGYVSYHSNDLSIEVDAMKASQVAKAINPLHRRTRESCNNTNHNEMLDLALRNTVAVANAAANAAHNGSASKFKEYFKTTDDSVRKDVVKRLRAIAKEAQSTNSGSTTYYCGDAFGYCSTNVLAYTLPYQNVIANCEIWYSYLPAMAVKCHQQDQATTALHEFTHAPGVYTPGTEDLGYGYSAATGLSSSDAVMNADTYALYANAVVLGC